MSVVYLLNHGSAIMRFQEFCRNLDLNLGTMKMKCECCGCGYPTVEVDMDESIYNKLKQLEHQVFPKGNSDMNKFVDFVASVFIDTCNEIKNLDSYKEFKSHLIYDIGFLIKDLRPEWKDDYNNEEQITQGL